MSDEQKPQVRVRVNVEHTASGKYTWSGTVELTDVLGDGRVFVPLDIQNATIDLSDKLVAELKERYGPKEQDLEATLKASIMAVEEAKKGAGA